MSALEQVAALIRRESGIAIKPSQLPALAAAIARTGPGWDAEHLLTATADPAWGRVAVERLIDEVAVKETFFFRHERELAAIEWRVLWDAARRTGREQLRAWSAACATGEEPYTLAIMACEEFGTPAPPVSILGTDISLTALEHAQRGEYGWRAVRELTASQRDRWFAVSGNQLVVGPELRRLVRVSKHNLVRDSLPPPGEELFDLIICRNVLIYFDRPTVRRTISALERALRPQGMLVIGAADRLSGPFAAKPPPRRPIRAAHSGPRAPVPVGAPHAPARKDALAAVHEWSLEATVEQTGELLRREPLNVDACFVRGVAQLAADDPAGAVVSLRRALYLEPDFALAAFKLARAYEALQDPGAARRAYMRALHSLRPDDRRSAELLDQLDIANVAIACRTRLVELDGAG
jgi:chemotaxis protein methyltransferase CheR